MVIIFFIKKYKCGITWVTNLPYMCDTYEIDLVKDSLVFLVDNDCLHNCMTCLVPVIIIQYNEVS